MNRLRDDAAEDPVAAKGIEILRGVQPAPRMTDLRRRVWMSLQQTPDRKAGGLRMPSVFTAARMKTFALVTTIVCVAGSAGAVITGRWTVFDRNRSASPSVRRSEITTTTKQGPKHRTKLAATEATTTAQEFADREIAEPALDGPTAGERQVPRSVSAPAPARASARHYAPVTAGPDRSARATAREPAAPSGILVGPPLTGAASARERTEVLDAMIALRRNHDPGRAGVLLDSYLTAHPRGGLHEEALALAIEAADGRDDRATARRLAGIYQSRYPKGRFVQFARSHTDLRTYVNDR